MFCFVFGFWFLSWLTGSEVIPQSWALVTVDPGGQTVTGVMEHMGEATRVRRDSKQRKDAEAVSGQDLTLQRHTPDQFLQ